MTRTKSINNEQIPTTERLALALEAADDPTLADMIVRARAGHYDDFKSDLISPIIQLVNDLRAAGHPDLAQRAINGEFDATPAEGEAWFEAEGLELLKHCKLYKDEEHE